MYLNRNGKALTLIILIILLSALNLYAGGQTEDKMPQALELIDQRQYNKAILVLTEIMKTNPDQFTEAQKLIRKISTARDKYNSLYDKLITLLDPPPGEDIDQDAAYAIIRDMEAIDSNPNKAAVAAFAQAKKSIVFAVDDRTYANIMNDAAALIQANKYTEAIKTYFKGFELHKDLFIERNYGNIVADQINIYQNEILTAAKDFLSSYDQVATAAKLYSDIIGAGDISKIELGYSNYSKVMLATGNKWRIMKANAEKLELLKKSTQRDDESDIPYISVKRVLTVGRSDSDIQEGIAGVVSSVWDSNQNVVSSPLLALMEKNYRSSVDSFEASEFSKSRISFANTVRLSVVAADVLKLRGDKLYLDNNYTFKDKGLNYLTKELPFYLLAQTVGNAGPVYTDMSLTSENLNSLVKSIEAASTVDSIEEILKKLKGVDSSLIKSNSDMLIISEKESSLQNIGYNLVKITNIFNELKKNQSDLSTNIFNAEVRAEERILIIKIAPEKVLIENAAESITNASKYIEGVDELIDGNTLNVKRPDSATRILNDTLTELDDSYKELAVIKASIKDKDKPIQDSLAVVKQMETVSDFRKQINDKKQQINQLLGKAKVLNDEADNAFSLGNLRLDESYSRFYRKDYDGARKKYYEAESQFLKSLTYREDQSVRDLLTGELAKLDSDITIALNKQIVREVRALINRGKNFYNLQEFIKAEQSFQQASERYKVTNDNKNPEIENWLLKIKRALEATSGREIALTDPLYPDIISILNLVQEEFEKGKSLLKSGDKEAADVHFTEALKNIELVKAPFPRNFKASVMYLQILEYTQSDAFQSFFKSMFDTAVKNIKVDPKQADDDLLALYEINPDYPGIKSAVYNSGVAAGRIIPPPAKVDIRRAVQLYKQAKAIVDADKSSQFPIALAYLEEAIQINSDYDAAAVLMDKIRTSTGGISQVEMSISDSQQLRYAESLYIDGRYLEANIIINQLWENPINRKSSKLNDLKGKVEARL